MGVDRSSPSVVVVLIEVDEFGVDVQAQANGAIFPGNRSLYADFIEPWHPSMRIVRCFLAGHRVRGACEIGSVIPAMTNAIDDG